MRTEPWHSSDPDNEVFHDNSDCPEGKDINEGKRRSGTGDDRRLCDRCAELND